MVTVIGVRFKKAGKIYYFDPDNIDTTDAKYVIVETARGIEFGSMVIKERNIPEDEVVAPLKKVLRVATDEDIKVHEENQEKKGDAFKVCLEKIKHHKLDMKLIDVEYTFDNNKVIFYFTSDGRVDFRELVKDLASVFRTRIELRQIGVRDEAKMINGIGSCGKRLCCANWLGDFEPVSIKMAKDQNLSLNPTKISGICGRLMCCLKYEHEVYLELKKGMPKDGETVRTPDGEAVVMSTQTIREQVKVRLIVGQDKGEVVLDEDISVYKKQEIKRIRKSKPHQVSQQNTEEKPSKDEVEELKQLEKAEAMDKKTKDKQRPNKKEGQRRPQGQRRKPDHSNKKNDQAKKSDQAKKNDHQKRREPRNKDQKPRQQRRPQKDKVKTEDKEQG